MKKYTFGIFAVVFAFALSAFSATSKYFLADTYQYIGPSNDPYFEMGDNSDPLDYAANWHASNPVCVVGINQVYLCKVRVTYPLTAPTKQQVIDAVKTEYDSLALFSQAFTDGYSFQVTIISQIVTIEIYLKHVN